MVNVAYDATVEQTPGAQIEEAEKRLFDLAEKGQYGAGFQAFETALLSAPSTWPAPPTSATAICRAWPPASTTSTG